MLVERVLGLFNVEIEGSCLVVHYVGSGGIEVTVAGDNVVRF
jgi:hypothetical protein